MVAELIVAEAPVAGSCPLLLHAASVTTISERAFGLNAGAAHPSRDMRLGREGLAAVAGCFKATCWLNSPSSFAVTSFSPAKPLQD